ncbi:hypothetical protein WCD74_01615 [Actinomycetospora sp. OC33-EN08]|uniref:DUF4261 domain-containing protein n=1 Tax=Actinomycetospora aurantiaca TaxID=3129233 RepID=A0ABU8MHL7_9PSEU
MTIRVEDVERGDILLVTQKSGDALAEMIIDYDRSPSCFSHSGIAGGDGTIISSYPDSLDGLRPVDVGGLHHDDFSHFWKLEQKIHRLVLPDDVDREAALKRLDDYPKSRSTRFGLASIVVVAGALHALNHEGRIGQEGTAEIVWAAITAAEAWASPDEFFCAEFSATIYDLTSVPFTVGDLRPPEELVRSAQDMARRVLIQLGLKGLLFGRSDEEQETLIDFVAAVEQYDPEFFDEGVKVLFEAVLDGLGVRRSRGLELPDSTPVPAALITPRMLEAWCGGVTEEIQQPAKT